MALKSPPPRVLPRINSLNLLVLFAIMCLVGLITSSYGQISHNHDKSSTGLHTSTTRLGLNASDINLALSFTPSSALPSTPFTWDVLDLTFNSSQIHSGQNFGIYTDIATGLDVNDILDWYHFSSAMFLSQLSDHYSISSLPAEDPNRHFVDCGANMRLFVNTDEDKLFVQKSTNHITDDEIAHCKIPIDTAQIPREVLVNGLPIDETLPLFVQISFREPEHDDIYAAATTKLMLSEVANTTQIWSAPFYYHIIEREHVEMLVFEGKLNVFAPLNPDHAETFEFSTITGYESMSRFFNVITHGNTIDITTGHQYGALTCTTIKDESVSVIVPAVFNATSNTISYTVSLPSRYQCVFQWIFSDIESANLFSAGFTFRGEPGLFAILPDIYSYTPQFHTFTVNDTLIWSVRIETTFPPYFFGFMHSKPYEQHYEFQITTDVEFRPIDNVIPKCRVRKHVDRNGHSVASPAYATVVQQQTDSPFVDNLVIIIHSHTFQLADEITIVCEQPVFSTANQVLEFSSSLFQLNGKSFSDSNLVWDTPWPTPTKTNLVAPVLVEVTTAQQISDFSGDEYEHLIQGVIATLKSATLPAHVSVNVFENITVADCIPYFKDSNSGLQFVDPTTGENTSPAASFTHPEFIASPIDFEGVSRFTIVFPMPTFPNGVQNASGYTFPSNDNLHISLVPHESDLSLPFCQVQAQDPTHRPDFSRPEVYSPGCSLLGQGDRCWSNSQCIGDLVCNSGQCRKLYHPISQQEALASLTKGFFGPHIGIGNEDFPQTLFPSASPFPPTIALSAAPVAYTTSPSGVGLVATTDHVYRGSIDCTNNKCDYLLSLDDLVLWFDHSDVIPANPGSLRGHISVFNSTDLSVYHNNTFSLGYQGVSFKKSYGRWQGAIPISNATHQQERRHAEPLPSHIDFIITIERVAAVSSQTYVSAPDIALQSSISFFSARLTTILRPAPAQLVSFGAPALTHGQFSRDDVHTAAAASTESTLRFEVQYSHQGLGSFTPTTKSYSNVELHPFGQLQASNSPLQGLPSCSYQGINTVSPVLVSLPDGTFYYSIDLLPTHGNFSQSDESIIVLQCTWSMSNADVTFSSSFVNGISVQYVIASADNSTAPPTRKALNFITSTIEGDDAKLPIPGLVAPFLAPIETAPRVRIGSLFTATSHIVRSLSLPGRNNNTVLYYLHYHYTDNAFIANKTITPLHINNVSPLLQLELAGDDFQHNIAARYDVQCVVQGPESTLFAYQSVLGGSFRPAVGSTKTLLAQPPTQTVKGRLTDCNDLYLSISISSDVDTAATAAASSSVTLVTSSLGVNPATNHIVRLNDTTQITSQSLISAVSPDMALVDYTWAFAAQNLDNDELKTVPSPVRKSYNVARFNATATHFPTHTNAQTTLNFQLLSHLHNFVLGRQNGADSIHCNISTSSNGVTTDVPVIIVNADSQLISVMFALPELAASAASVDLSLHCRDVYIVSQSSAVATAETTLIAVWAPDGLTGLNQLAVQPAAKTHSKRNVVVIIGIIVAILVVLAGIVLAVRHIRQRNKNEHQDVLLDGSYTTLN